MSQKMNYNYFLDENDKELADKSKDNIRYISKKTFKKAVDDGLEYRIVGRTKLKDEKNGEKHQLLQAGEDSYLIDKYKCRRIAGYIPVGDGKYLEYMGLWLPLFLILGTLLAAVIVGGIIYWNHKDDTKFNSRDTIVEETEADDGEADPDMVLTIVLPAGTSELEGNVYEPGTKPEDDNAAEEGTPYTGSANLKAVMTVDGEEHTVTDFDTDVKKGQVSDFTLDFTILDYELTQGTYDGTMYITYPDGSEEEQTLSIVILQSMSGQMDIGYSPNVTIDLDSLAISCKYTPDSKDTHNTVVQLVLLNDGEEYVLAESGTVKPGETLKGMTLGKSWKSKLESGTYDGYLRLTFSADTDEGEATDLNTDLAVEINVQ